MDQATKWRKYSDDELTALSTHDYPSIQTQAAAELERRAAEVRKAAKKKSRRNPKKSGGARG